MATTQSREMSDEHKAALATGRAQSRAVKAYLEALKTNKPKRGRKRTTESITKRLEVIADELNSADALQEVLLLQEQTDLQTELESFDQQIDMSALERDFVANAAPQKTLFVCEGPTDTAAAVELGLFAVGRPNCCCGGTEIKVYARRHAVSRVVVISDNDKPGLDGARKVGGELKLPFAIYVPPAKDLREFVRLGGTRVMIENTLKGTVWQNG